MLTGASLGSSRRRLVSVGNLGDDAGWSDLRRGGKPCKSERAGGPGTQVLNLNKNLVRRNWLAALSPVSCLFQSWHLGPHGPLLLLSALCRSLLLSSAPTGGGFPRHPHAVLRDLGVHDHGCPLTRSSLGALDATNVKHGGPGGGALDSEHVFTSPSSLRQSGPCIDQLWGDARPESPTFGQTLANCDRSSPGFQVLLGDGAPHVRVISCTRGPASTSPACPLELCLFQGGDSAILRVPGCRTTCCVTSSSRRSMS